MEENKTQGARRWVSQAFHDLEMAEKNISIGGYDIAAFLAHQAVEKLFKGILCLEQNVVPKIHYLDELANLLKLDESLIEDVFDLTSDYTFSRYPDVSVRVPFEEYNEEIARDKVSRAKKIFQTLRSRFQKAEPIQHE